MDLLVILDAGGAICSDPFEQTCPNWESVLEFVVNVVSRLPVSEVRNTYTVHVRDPMIYFNNSCIR